VRVIKLRDFDAETIETETFGQPKEALHVPQAPHRFSASFPVSARTATMNNDDKDARD